MSTGKEDIYKSQWSDRYVTNNEKSSIQLHKKMVSKGLVHSIWWKAEKYEIFFSKEGLCHLFHFLAAYLPSMIHRSVASLRNPNLIILKMTPQFS
jgi:hypothetical protein